MNFNFWNFEFPQDHLKAFICGSEIAFITKQSEVIARLIVWENQVNVLNASAVVSINRETRMISIG